MELTQQKHRKRRPNFSRSEQLLLLELVKGCSAIQSSSRTLKTQTQREQEWGEISATFQAHEDGGNRSRDELKVTYGSLVQRAKKRSSEERVHARTTGGGLPPPPFPPPRPASPLTQTVKETPSHCKPAWGPSTPSFPAYTLVPQLEEQALRH